MREFEQRGLLFWLFLGLAIFVVLCLLPGIDLWIEITVSVIPILLKIIFSFHDYFKKLKWTTGKPTIEGWYWANLMRKNRWETYYEIRAVKVISASGRLEVQDDEMNYGLNNFTHFIGPIKQPDSPIIQKN